HAALILASGSSAAAHAAAASGVPAFVWVDRFRSMWHLDYVRWRHFRICAPFGSTRFDFTRTLEECLETFDLSLPTDQSPRRWPPGVASVTLGDHELFARAEQLGHTDVIESVLVRDNYEIDRYEDLAVRTVLDVGTHVGAFVHRLKQAWPEARVIALEPNPRSCELLRANVAHWNGVETRQVALRYDGTSFLTESEEGT